MTMTRQSKKMLCWTSVVLVSCALALFAGCSQSDTGSAVTAALPSDAALRSTQVPNGIETSSGLSVPRGFEVNVFAEGLTNPRRIAIAPNGSPEKYDVFVAESKANRIRVLRDSNGDGRADEKFVFTNQVVQPYGIAFHEGWMYIGDTDAVVRLPYEAGQTSSVQPPQQISRLTAGGYNQHWTRNLLFSPDGKKLFVTVGSSCNTCEESDPQRAAISVMNPDGSDKRVFASGLRNPVGMAWRNNDELWTVVNERDQLGDDVPPDYLTLVKDGGFYGWPYAFTTLDRKVVPDPQFGDKAPEKIRSTLPPSVPVQAHSAALGLAFYPQKGNFPAEYSGDAFLAFHGSWNRSERTGYKIVRVNFENGKTVSISDFVSGFLRDDGRVWGRPVDVQIAPDGSLLFSDDGGGKIWRVSRTERSG
jgi:glucose/arabinose dehydrogenase